MLDGAKMHTWFDTEWDYGFAAGIQALRKSVDLLAGYDLQVAPAVARAGRGPAKSATPCVRRQAASIWKSSIVRGYGVGEASIAYQDKVSKPTADPRRLAGVAAPVQVQTPELLAQLRPDSRRQWPRPDGGLRPARREVPRRLPCGPARPLRTESDRRGHHHPHARRPFPGSAAPAGEMGCEDLGNRPDGGQDGAP